MWRPYLIYLYNTLKVATLGLVAIVAWYLAIWATDGDFGIAAGAYEYRGSLQTKFLGLFFLFLLIGVGIATPLLWGGEKRGPGDLSQKDSRDGI